tara:strand:- start:120 stop:335 length:216 start_codon:yes stop_codon:yes gene_type:complete
MSSETNPMVGFLILVGIVGVIGHLRHHDANEWMGHQHDSGTYNHAHAYERLNNIANNNFVSMYKKAEQWVN